VKHHILRVVIKARQSRHAGRLRRKRWQIR